MSEADTTTGPSRPASRNIFSNASAEVTPTDYYFLDTGNSVRLVYYHDEKLIVAEVSWPDGQSGFQAGNIKVQDFAATIVEEEFVRWTCRRRHVGV